MGGIMGVGVGVVVSARVVEREWNCQIALSCNTIRLFGGSSSGGSSGWSFEMAAALTI